MKLVVLDAKTLGEDLDLSLLQEFGEVTVYPATPPERTAERIADCDTAIFNKVRLTEEVLRSAPRLRLVCVTATGYDNVDVDYCAEHGIAVCNVSGYAAHSVAQLTVSAVLSLANHLQEYRTFVTSGRYTESGVHNCLTPVFHELYGKTWGILGYGAIGKEVAKAAEAFGCRVIVSRRTPCEGAAQVPPEQLYRESDILTLHIPLTGQTKGMIGARELAMMKPNVILVNAARGGVWDEEAVASALEQGRIGAVGTDVYTTEPLQTENPLWRLREHPRFCPTPHMAWGAYEARVRCMEEVAENIRAFLRGEKRNRVEN